MSDLIICKHREEYDCAFNVYNYTFQDTLDDSLFVVDSLRAAYSRVNPDIPPQGSDIEISVKYIDTDLIDNNG